MNIQFLQRSVSPLHLLDICEGYGAASSLTIEGSISKQQQPHQMYGESPRVRPKGDLCPMNLHAAHFSGKESSPRKDNDEVGLSHSSANTPTDSGRHQRGRLRVSKDYRSSNSNRRSLNSGSTRMAHSITESIPISSESMKRTSSELQLLEDEAVAAYRDECMYNRILNGISEHYQSWNGETIDTVRHIMETRHKPIDQHVVTSSYVRESRVRHSIAAPLATKKEDVVVDQGQNPHQQWPAHPTQATSLRPLIDDPESSLYNSWIQRSTDRDLWAHATIVAMDALALRTVDDSSAAHISYPCSATFQASTIDLDDEQLFQMDDI
jgi:hypothetical protein